jgi:phosphate starvation-inducible protein PhoH and related proteins
MDRTIAAASENEARAVLGDGDGVLRALAGLSDTRVTARGLEIHLSGAEDQILALSSVVEGLLRAARKGQPLSAQDAAYLGRRALAGEEVDVDALLQSTILISERGKPVRAKSLGQIRYVQAIRESPITFGIGPAGTGKTYLAMATAIAAFNAHEYERIILSRPAVEAGESLGFLPGDLREKVDPYLRPLYDALYDMVRLERAQRLIERGSIEVVPLAYMRGRTLNDAFIILDEAQNSTAAQMKMFLTRMGFSSKIVVTGDRTQVDLPRGRASGLLHASELLDGIDGIRMVELTEEDVVRHPLVRRIIRAYEREGWEREKPAVAEGEVEEDAG